MTGTEAGRLMRILGLFHAMFPFKSPFKNERVLMFLERPKRKHWELIG